MTLPSARPLHADKAQVRAHARRGSRARCFSAAWVELQPALRKSSARRAVCSWHVDYGSLQEVEKVVPGRTGLESKDTTAFKKEKVADYVSLLGPSPSPRILNGTGGKTATAPPVVGVAPSIAVAQQNGQAGAPSGGVVPSLKSLFCKARGGAGNSGAATPLVGAGSVEAPPIKPAVSLANLRKCETVLALTGILRSASSSSSIEPLQPLNRLRVKPDNGHPRMCSRCSSLLTLASDSRYSLDSAAGGFVRLPPEPPVLCKLCLAEVSSKAVVRLDRCSCCFCKECMRAYVEFEIAEGAYDISCPDAQCQLQGVLQEEEIKLLAGVDLLTKHKKYRLNREVELDKTRCWCPKAGCETVCALCPSQPCTPQSVFCPTCSNDFCSNCKLEWHEGVSCEEHGRRLAQEGRGNVDIGIPFDSDLIKCCPMCGVPIEKDEGCAQMMCKRCKHVFCWYCLASLDDDFLLRHYDKGPCKNKLGHSRASVIWHRTQVIGIFAGFGILLLVASPLLLLAAPCIVCCKCRICNAGTTKLDNEDEAAADES